MSHSVDVPQKYQTRPAEEVRMEKAVSVQGQPGEGKELCGVGRVGEPEDIEQRTGGAYAHFEATTRPRCEAVTQRPPPRGRDLLLARREDEFLVDGHTAEGGGGLLYVRRARCTPTRTSVRTSTGWR